MNVKSILTVLLLMCSSLGYGQEQIDVYGLFKKANELYNANKQEAAKATYQKVLDSGDSYFASDCKKQLKKIEKAISKQAKANAAKQHAPVDVSFLIKNRSFTYSSSKDWETDIWSNGNTYDLNAACNCFEFWNCAFNFYQKLKVPNGKYTLSCQGYNRPSSTEDFLEEGTVKEPVTAELYANEASVKLKHIKDYALEQPPYPNKKYGVVHNPAASLFAYYPDNMEVASLCLKDGKYPNSVSVEVNNSELIIGVKNMHFTENTWSIFTDFRLMYEGEAACDSLIKRMEDKAVVTYKGETIRLIDNNSKAMNLDFVNKSPYYTADDNGIKALVTGKSKLSDDCNIIVLDPADETAQWEDVTERFIKPEFVEIGPDGWNYTGNRMQAATILCKEFFQYNFEFSQCLKLPRGIYRFRGKAFYRPGAFSVTNWATTMNRKGWLDDEYKDMATGNDNGWGCTIFAGQTEKEMATVYDYYETEKTDAEFNGEKELWESPSGQLFPNNPIGANKMFEHDCYYNHILFYSDGETPVYVGIHGQTGNMFGEEWCIFQPTSFKLEQLTSPIE